MGWLFAIFVVGLVMYWLSKLGEKALSTESTPQKTEGSLRENLEGTPGQDDFEVTVSHQETPSGAIDLREDAKRLLRIVGSGHWVESDIIRQHQSGVFFLHREPDNKHDENAIAVYGGKRKFGYIAASAAKQYAPLLDQIGSSFVVRRNYRHYTGDSFYLPYIPVLRERIKKRKLQEWRPEVEDLEGTAKPRVSLSKPKKELTGGHPLIGGPYKNGNRVYGDYGGYAADLREKGTPKVSSLKSSSLTPAIQDVRIGDKLLLTSVNETLVVSKSGREVGLLNWQESHDVFDGGTLEVQRIVISPDGNIANCGGIAIPA